MEFSIDSTTVQVANKNGNGSQSLSIWSPGLKSIGVAVAACLLLAASIGFVFVSLGDGGPGQSQAKNGETTSSTVQPKSGDDETGETESIDKGSRKTPDQIDGRLVAPGVAQSGSSAIPPAREAGMGSAIKEQGPSKKLVAKTLDDVSIPSRRRDGAY